MFKVKLLPPEIDSKTKHTLAKLEILDGNYREFIDVASYDKEYDVSIRRHGARRSLDANAYYHVLVRKIAHVLGSSEAEVKNATLGRYGQLELDEDGRPIELFVPDSWRVEKRADVHLAPTGEVDYQKGRVGHWHYVIKGSRHYNRAEMYRLIQGTIDDARDAGLTDAEIMTPAEKELLGNVYGIAL